MPKAILIDSENRTVSWFDYNGGIGQLHKLVGGYIECGWQDPESGDTLYVDEDGLRKPQTAFFRFSGRTSQQPLAGNGVIVGRELVTDEGDFLGNADVKATIALVTSAVQFLNREQVMAWARGNASEPIVTFAAIDEHGKIGKPEIIQRTGSFFEQMPKPETKEGE